MIVSKEDIRKHIIKKHKTYQQTADALGVSKSAVARAAKKYRQVAEVEEGFTGLEHNRDQFVRVERDEALRIRELEHALQVERQKVSDLRRGLGRHISVTKQSSSFKIGIISDTHYGSLYHDASSLRAFLEYAKGEEVVEILHAGDVLEGEHMHFGQERELSHAGFTKQIRALVESYPSDIGIPVKFITGNHDLSYRKAAGIEVGDAIAYEMGWENLGDAFGEIKYETENGDYRIVLVHPGGGSAYALSYRLQKQIEQWEGGKKPNMLIAGHFHKAIWLPQYRNISALHPGCFQRQTPFMASKSLAAHVAGVILDITVGPKKEMWNRVNAEFVSFY